MDIATILTWRFPNTEDHWRVAEDPQTGRQSITYWNEALMGVPQPTESDLRSWWLAAEKHRKRSLFRIAADSEYERLLAPEGNLTLVQRDEILEKKAITKAGGSAPMSAAEKRASDNIDALREKRRSRWAEVAGVVQDPGETLEAAVERVRAIAW